MNEIDYKERIQELNKEFEQELNEWEKLNVDPVNVFVFNTYKNETWIKALTLFLAEKGIIVEDEFVVFMKEHQIKTLKDLRPQIEEQIKRARMESLGIEVPNMSVPRSNLKKMH